jgi:hypothetical protein
MRVKENIVLDFILLIISLTSFPLTLLAYVHNYEIAYINPGVSILQVSIARKGDKNIRPRSQVNMNKSNI